MNAPVFSAEGDKQEAGRELPQALFDGVVHEAAMWQTVKAYLANQRRTTAATRTRAQVRGGGRKPWRQKGTGRSRQGSIRSPQWRGGGVVFGPSPLRNYRQDVPKKVRWLARRSAYNARAQEERILLIEPLALEAPRTKSVIALLEGVEAAGNVLLLTAEHKPLVYLSARNIPRVQVRQFGDESAYDVLWADTVIIELPALERAQEVAHA